MCDFEVQKSRLLGEPTASRSDRNFAFPDFSSYQSSFLGSKIVVIRVFFLWEMRGFALFYRVNSAFVWFSSKLIGFKLSDLFYAIFHQYYLAYQDNRAERLAKYIKYGTEDSTEIWMLRYGFSFEEIEWLKPCVESIDQTEIRFNGEIESLDDFQRSSIAQYLF